MSPDFRNVWQACSAKGTIERSCIVWNCQVSETPRPQTNIITSWWLGNFYSLLHFNVSVLDSPPLAPLQITVLSFLHPPDSMTPLLSPHKSGSSSGSCHWNHDIFSLQKSGPYHKAHCRVSLIQGSAPSRAGKSACCPEIIVFAACECHPCSPLVITTLPRLLFPAFVHVNKQTPCHLILQWGRVLRRHFWRLSRLNSHVQVVLTRTDCLRPCPDGF